MCVTEGRQIMEDVKIDVLLNEERYDDAIDLMQDKYVDLFIDMLNKKNADMPKNRDFYCYTSRIMSEYPNLISRIEMLRKGIVNKDFSYLDEIELLKNTYNYLKVNY
jgi:hypothetical protein